MAEKTMMLEIISPDRMFYKGEVTMLEMTTTEGETGIYPGHIPMTNVLKPGIITIHEENEVKRAAVHAGFSQILQDKVTILAEIAEWPGEIDIARAREAQERAEQRLSSKDEGIDVKRAEIALRKALIRIELVERYK